MIIGTRASDLAMAQTSIVIDAMRRCHPGVVMEIKKITTTGDAVKDRPLSALGGFGAFVRELDDRLLAGEIDVEVNSLKDMAVEPTPGTELAAVLPRAPVEDILMSKVPLMQLPNGAVVGSSSVRRTAQLLAKRPDLMIRDLRGNVPTRIRRWKQGDFDAIALARAGLMRLKLPEEGFILDPEEFIPAAGQGAIAVVCRKGSEHAALLRSINDDQTRSEVKAERHILRLLGGGCSIPVGVWARNDGSSMRVKGVMFSSTGATRVDRTIPLNDLEAGLKSIASALAGREEGT